MAPTRRVLRPCRSMKCKGRKRLASLLTTALVLVAVLGPLAFAGQSAIKEGAVLMTRDWDLSHRLNKIRAQFGLQMPHQEQFARLQSLFVKIMPIAVDKSPTKEVSGRQLETLDAIAAELDKFRDKLDIPAQPNQTSRKDRLLAAAGTDIQRMHDSIAQAREAVSTMIDNGANPQSMQSYDKSIDRVNVQLESLRDDLSGGFPYSSLVLLANPSAEEMERWQTTARDYLKDWLLSITGRSTAALAGVFFGLAVMLISIYYFLIDGSEMIKSAMRLSPLDDRYEEELLVKFGQVSRAVVLATLLSAVVQGLLAGIGYFFAGLEPVFLLTMLTMLLAMVPFVGAAAIWLPAALYVAFIDERMAAGIGLAIYGTVVVSMADNIIKPLILHGESNMHPLMALLSVLGGVQALGPIGILVGPMLLAFFQALLNMLHSEITEMTSS
jgi:predicted PurR-regulated permease PerM